MGHEPLTKWVVLFVVSLQLTIAYLLRHTAWSSPLFLVCAYVVGGTANHNLFLAIHEITHNLAFKGVKANKMLAIFANLPIGIPYAATFKVCVTCWMFTKVSGTYGYGLFIIRNIISNIISTLARMESIPTCQQALSFFA